MKLPKGVLNEKELNEILEEETGLGETAEGQFDKKALEERESGSDAMLVKTRELENEIRSLKSELVFLREKLNEQSDVLLELIKLVKELKK